jgi:MFS family permease
MYRKNVRLLKIFNFLIGFSLFAPLAILYFSKVAGSYTLGASIFGIVTLASAIFEVPTGMWSDRVGRRGTIILGSWARVIAFIFYAIGLSYWWLVAGAILEGLSRSFYSGNNDVFLHDTLTDDGLESEYDDYLGKVSSTEQLALGLSALAGGIIATWSFNYLLWLSVISQLGVLYVSYLFIEPKSRRKLDTNLFAHLFEAIKIFMTNKKLRLVSITSIINYSFSEMIYQFRAVFISTVWPLWAIGLANVLSNFGATWSFYYSGKIIKKFTAVNILLFKAFWNKFASILAYSLSNIFSPIILATSSLLFGVSSVAESKLMQKEFSDHQRSTMASLNSFAGNIAFAIMSVVLGSLADVMSPSYALIILNLVSLPVIYLYYLLFKNDRKIKA